MPILDFISFCEGSYPVVKGGKTRAVQKNYTYTHWNRFRYFEVSLQSQVHVSANFQLNLICHSFPFKSLVAVRSNLCCITLFEGLDA